MVARQEALGRVILRDPAVESLSSFIGIDGTNMTLNSGRILINLKPSAQRRLHVEDVIRRLSTAVADVDGIALFMQPVQDLTIDDRLSRTQYQYTLEDPDGAELHTWAPRLVDALRRSPVLREVSTDQLDGGAATALVFVAHAALGIRRGDRRRLYNAFVSASLHDFTQLNPSRRAGGAGRIPHERRGAAGHLVRGATGGTPCAEHDDQARETRRAASPEGPFPAVTPVVQTWRAGVTDRPCPSWGDDPQVGLPQSSGHFQGPAGRFVRAGNEPL